MYERINYAITYCLFIDGDGNMNEAPVPTDFNADPSLDDEWNKKQQDMEF